MADKMTFPKTLDEFMEQYKIVDTEQVYTNGIELIPIFRIKQWEDAHRQTKDKQTEADTFHAVVYDIDGVRAWGIHIQYDRCGAKRVVIDEPPRQYNFCPNCGADMREDTDETTN